MANNIQIHLERDLAQAHLLITRGQIAEAKALLSQLARAGVSQKDTQPLLDAIRDREYEAKQADERKRDMRYYLGLRRTWARAMWLIAATLGGAHALVKGSSAIARGMARGFTTVITTREYTKHGSYLWTRPIYLDLIYASIELAIMVMIVGVVLWAARGAAQCEATDAPDPSRYRTWPLSRSSAGAVEPSL